LYCIIKKISPVLTQVNIKKAISPFFCVLLRQTDPAAVFGWLVSRTQTAAGLVVKFVGCFKIKLAFLDGVATENTSAARLAPKRAVGNSSGYGSVSI
jgi:hypothetical protein